MTSEQKCLLINERTPEGGLFTDERREVHPDSHAPWRIAPEPFWLSVAQVDEFRTLGRHLLSFYEACNTLYLRSVRGTQPPWISAYLDQGKPEAVVEYGRMRRLRRDLPLVIRPDVILTEHGPMVTELDSVPGGIGFTGSLSQRYAGLGYDLVGGGEGMVETFAEMIRSVSEEEDLHLAIVVSDEAQDYRDEMVWLGGELNRIGLPTQVVHPSQVRFTEEHLEVEGHPVDVLYRFFELFDLKNIPKSELILYSAKKRHVVLTPPAKAYLEEKLWFALFHHPALAPFWRAELGKDGFAFLRDRMPRTWILDPRPLPPHAVIPGLSVGDDPVARWDQIKEIPTKRRDLVVKPSGFSELAWGSRGVSVGNDLSAQDWAETVDTALSSFETTPYILQEFHKGKRFALEYYDFQSGSMRRMNGRARLSPYYFIVNQEPKLSGILATICPPDKKLIHGMVDAAMIPCGVRSAG